MAASFKYRQGRLIWARLRSRGGKKELHPAIIISADQDITQPEDFDPRLAIDKVNAVAVVGVSTEFKRYPPYVLLPYSPKRGGHPVTNLSAECAACIGWYNWVVLEDDVEGRGGDVPLAELIKITSAVADDLRRKLSAKAGKLNSELLGIYEILVQLIGEP